MLSLKPIPFTASYLTPSAMDNWVFKANVSGQLKKTIIWLYSLKGRCSIQAHVASKEGRGARDFLLQTHVNMPCCPW